MTVYQLIAIVAVLLSLAACSQPPSDAGTTQNIPFDRQPHTGVVSPSQNFIPSTTTLPEGTSIPVLLQKELSSASAHAGDTFETTVDEDVTVDEKALIKKGTSAIGRVLEAKSAVGSQAAKPRDAALEPGYLRVVLVSVDIDGKPITIETSSIFARGGTRATGKNKDAVFAPYRRLNFRLAQSVDLK